MGATPSARTTARVGFGTGGLLRISSARQRRETLAAALANGIEHFDTAPLYGFGEAERSLGRFLRGQRGKVTLATKFGLRASPLAARLAVLQGVARRAIQLFPALRRTAVRNAGALRSAPTFSLATARASLESSLRALQTDYVDFYLAHQASAEALPGEDLIGWLEDLKRAGTIRAYGVATDFELLQPVLQQRPQLSRVVQFDSDPRSRNVESLDQDPQRLLITFTFIGRGVAACREQLARAHHPAFAGVTEDELGGLLLRAAVLANPGGIVLMQSRSPTRIERNVRAAQSPGEDERLRSLADLLRSTP